MTNVMRQNDLAEVTDGPSPKMMAYDWFETVVLCECATPDLLATMAWIYGCAGNGFEFWLDQHQHQDRDEQKWWPHLHADHDKRQRLAPITSTVRALSHC